MPFVRSQGRLLANDIPLTDIAASVGTPCYVYIWQDIAARYAALERALSSCNHARICYAVKANSNLTILHRLADLGAGFDIVSGGELERVLLAVRRADQVVFSGVGKTREEIGFGLKVGIECFNVESDSEANRINEVAGRLGIQASLAVRINPNIEVDTHPYITTGLKENKFGLAEPDAIALAKRIQAELEHCSFAGIACHIGSQINALEPFEKALDAMLEIRNKLEAHDVDCASIDLGGGFGICYHDEVPLSFEELGSLIGERDLGDLKFGVEPGRSLIGEAGALLTHVEYLKPATQPGYKHFCVVDAAMNDLIRPALYQAYHAIEKVEDIAGEKQNWNVVGPVCETGDFLGLDREFEAREGELLAVMSAGAYGSVLSSNYNSRPRGVEVLVDGDSFATIRKRESVHDMLSAEVA